MTNRAQPISPREREGGTEKVTRENSRKLSTQDERVRSNSLSSRVSLVRGDLFTYIGTKNTSALCVKEQEKV